MRAGESIVFFPSAADVADARVDKAGARVAKDSFDEAVDHLREGDRENQVEGVVMVHQPGRARDEGEDDFFLEEVVNKEGDEREGAGEAPLAVVGKVARDLLEADDELWILLEVHWVDIVLESYPRVDHSRIFIFNEP